MTSPFNQESLKTERLGAKMQSGEAGGTGTRLSGSHSRASMSSCPSCPGLTHFTLFSIMASPEMGRVSSSLVL